MEDFRVVSISMSSSKFIRLVKVSSVVSICLYSVTYWCHGFWESCFFAGDLSLMPEVSVELVCNLMEGILASF